MTARAPVQPPAQVPPDARLAGVGWRPRLTGRRARAAMWVMVPLGIVLLSWRALPLEPLPGLDDSWHAGLAMALHDGITFGNHLIFAYGPLGFLSVPTLWYTDIGIIAVSYTVLLRVALAAAVFAAARRSYGTAVGAIVALAVAGATGVGATLEGELPSLGLEAIPFLVFAVWVVDRVTDRRRLVISMAVGGAIAGLELLNKESVGLNIAVLTVIMALAARGRRRDNVTVSLGALVVTLLAAWTVTGQSWGALPAYVHNSAQIVSGYALAMSYEEAGLGWQYAAALVAFAFGLVAALHMTADQSSVRRRWGIVALWVAFCFFEFKDGFVRHDQIHGALFFVGLLGGFVALRWRGRWRPVGLGLTVALFACAVVAQNTSLSAVFDFGDSASEAIHQLGQVINPAERHAIMTSGRGAIELAYPIDEGTLDLLQGQTVHVAPYQASVAWAYGLDWRPLPVFQSYSAYTTGLDQDDANALTSPDAPQRILSNLNSAIDGRVSAFDEGLTTRTILCRYEELRTTPAWQVLGLGPNRCQTPVALDTVRADWGETVAVPPPPNDRSFVFVRISGVAVGGIERLTALLYRPDLREVVLEGVPHRLIAGTASDGLVLRAPADVDFSAPFNIAPNSSSIAVSKAGQGTSGGLPITFSFFSESVAVGPRYAPLQRAIIGKT
jgi:hypothetical protein